MLVGRARALALADALVADAATGRGRVLLIAGEAGIGKTALAREIVHRAEAAGAEPHWGACFEGASLLPYGVWIDCLRHPPESPCAGAATLLEGGEAEMADVATDVPTARQQRLRLFHDVVADVRAATAEKPQALVLEDLHWADRGSVELLGAFAGAVPAMPLLVVATYRDDELDPAGPLAGIGGGAERLTLGGLAEEDVARLLADGLGRQPSPDETQWVQRQTGGNPLFVTQMARLAHHRTGSPPTVPIALRDVLARRLARASSWCDRVLGAAAVVGTEFDLATIAAVLGEPDDRVLDAVDEAVRARLVVPGDEPDRWHFVHELIRSARYDVLGANERRAGHRVVTEVLAARGGVPAGVLAHHAALASFDRDDLRPATYEVDAAREALRRMAWDEAVTLARRALRSAPLGPSGDELRGQAWLALGDTLLRSGDDRSAGDAFAAAAELGRRSSSADLVARAALGFGAGLGSFEVRLLDRRQVELLEEAASVLDPASPFRALVLARLSVALSFLGSEQRRLALADEAISLARARGDDRALAAALAARCDAVAGPDHVPERLAAATEVVGLAQRAGDVTLELLGRRLRVVALLEQRDLAGFDAETAAYEHVASSLGDPFYGWYADMWRAMRAHADGRLEEATRLADRAAAAGGRAGSHNAPLMRGALMVFVFLDRSEADRAEEQWRELMAHDLHLAEANAAAVTALVDLCAGRAERARWTLERFGTQGLDRFPKDQEWLANLAQGVLAAARAGHRRMAQHAYELLAPYAGMGVFEGIASMDHGVVDRFLALAAGCCGDAGATLRHTEAALDGVAGAGRLVVAHTRADGARALLATGDASLRARAAELARRAADDYEEMGLAALAASVRGLGGSAPAPAAGRAEQPALVREGDTWAFSFAGTTVRVRHAKGVADLGVLLSQPGRPVHVRALEGVDGLLAPASTDAALDHRAVTQYRQRLRDLDEELDEAERHADSGRAEQVAAERDALVDQLTTAFGLAGRPRASGSGPDERLRKAVSARVKATIDRVEAMHPVLGHHLRRSVRTGYWCSYEPEHPVEWTVVGHRHR